MSHTTPDTGGRMNNILEEIYQEQSTASKIIEDTLLKHIGSVNSFVDRNGYNHFKEAVEEIYIRLSTYFDHVDDSEDGLFSTPFAKGDQTSEETP